mmetsp:Transcript_62277/g.178700  ORF Transcript_62277/g.178700 Transcript_62277/m.178700 type:complete len:202 (+) Transcript_62277:279-884(+)
MRSAVLVTTWLAPSLGCFARLKGGSDAGAPLFVTFLAREAHISDIIVSFKLFHAGEQFTNIKVLADPPNESCMICVSLWLRYGTHFCFVAIASMTSPNAVSDLLISMASFWWWPMDSDFFKRSDPPKSQSKSLPDNNSPVCRFVLSTLMMKIRCDRELSMFMAFAATVRCERPRFNKSFNSGASSTTFSQSESTITFPAAS